MRVREIKCKSLLNPSKLCDYCVNPYVGCTHKCIYCYAETITKKFFEHKEEWGEFVWVKINAERILLREIMRKKKGSVFFSSLTDPYQPLEKKYELSRKCLEILLRNNFSIWVQTKSALIKRDLDLFKKFKEKCEVCFTLTNLEKKIKKKFEPFSSSTKAKLEAIKLFVENGIRVSVFFGPFLPIFSEIKLEEFLKSLKEVGVKNLLVDKLNLKLGVWEKVEKVLKNYPEILDKWERIFFGWDKYYEEIKFKIRKLCEEFKLKVEFCFQGPVAQW